MVIQYQFHDILAGAGGEVPNTLELAQAGVQSFESEGDSCKQTDSLLAKLNSSQEVASVQMPTVLVTMGTGLPALPKKLVAKILANEYIDFTKLPPARPAPQALEGQVVVVQAADLLQSRKMILDLGTWIQGFLLYTATLATKFPSRVPELMAYQTIIVNL